MAYLAAAVIVVGLLCLLDLVLTYGVIRRLREHTERLNELHAGTAPTGGVPVGEVVGEFAATTTEGEPVSRELLTGPTLVGFFSPGCEPCAAELPRFVEHAESMPDGARQVLAMVDGDADVATEYTGRLSPVARVVLEGHGGALGTAFAVTGYPALYVVGGDGTVLATGYAMSDLEGALAADTTAA